MRSNSFLRLLCFALAALLLLPRPARAEETAPQTLPTEETIQTEPTSAEMLPEETQPAQLQTEPAQSEEPKGPGLYFGQLHAHCSLSDGTGSAREAFAHAANVPGLDFFALTDHSNSFDNGEAGRIGSDGAAVSADWADGKAAAEGATTRDFLALYGYEMTWQDDKQLGHINTFGTPGFQTRDQSGFSSYKTALPNYYDALTTVPGSVSQFNHPGTLYGDFQDFGHYTPSRDESIHLLELGTGADLLTYYDRALEQGWHVAPSFNQNNHFGSWGDADDRRTAVYASSLTEEGILAAIRDYRVYATEDKDLTLSYTLDGFSLGSRLEKRHVGETAEITVSLWDPTDGSACTVSVMAQGQTIVSADASGSAVFTVPAHYRYYYIVVTQPDGDRAVSAPVWIDQEENVTAALTWDGSVAVQDQELTLTLTLENGEGDPIHIHSTEWFADGEPIFSTEEDLAHARSTKTWTLPYVHPGLGKTVFTVRAEASFCGQPRTYEASLELTFRPPEITADILVDAAHGNAGLEEMTALTALAAEKGLTLALMTEEPGSFSDRVRVLIVTAPEEAFSEDHLRLTAEFVENGGCLLVCGQAGGSAELNRLLAAVGADMTLNPDTARDPVNNGGEEWKLFLNVEKGSAWYAPEMAHQVYRHWGGCTLSGGEALVRCENGPVLAWTGVGKGCVIASGGSFLGDADLAVPRGLWAQPWANRTLVEKLLGVYQEQLPLSAIRQARNGAENDLFRVRGYVTAGFADTVYLQDDSGGIAAVSLDTSGLQVGTPLEVTGYAARQGEERVLEVIQWQVLEEGYFRCQPRSLSYGAALNNSLHGGELVELEGEVVQFTGAEDGSVSEFTLADGAGGYAVVHIGEGVTSGSTGQNRLEAVVRSGRDVRVIGISYLRSDGVAVIRVRNCDEVVAIDPWPYHTRDASNPATGDALGLALTAMLLSAAGLLLILRKKELQA